MTMISTASIEPANSVNVELSWKRVTKGVRSATRRPRKINWSLIMGLQHNDKGTKEEPSVTESEEFGVAILGNHFSEKIDHLPIKKRRSMQQSPSPPPHIPLDQWCGVPKLETGALDGLLPIRAGRRGGKSVVNEKPSCSEDSYGIELLAAAACNTCVNDDVHNVKAVKVEEKFEALHRGGASIHATTLEVNDVCSQKEDLLSKHIKCEDHADSREQNSPPVASGDIHDTVDGGDGKGSSSRNDVRLRWDLNTVMDDWELTPENMNINSARNGLAEVNIEGLHSEETEKLEASFRHRDPVDAWELLKCPMEIEVPAQVISKSNIHDNGLSPRSDSIPSESPFVEKLNPPTAKMIAKVEDHCLSSDLGLGQTLAVEDVQLEKQDVPMVDLTVSETSVCDVVSININEDKMSELRNSGSVIKLMGTTLDPRDPSSKLGEASPSSEKCQDLAEKHDINVPPTSGAPVDSSSEVKVKKLELKSYEHIVEDTLDDLLDDGYVSDNSLGVQHHLVRIEKISRYQLGCESPVEDGELRESVDHSWQENEDETDCLDYDTDDRGAADGFFMGNVCVSEAGSGSNQINGSGNLSEKVSSGKTDSSKESSHSATAGNSGGLDQIPEGCVHVSKTVEANNTKLGEVGVFDSTRTFDIQGSLERKVGSRATRGKVSTRLQGSSGPFYGKDTRDARRSSSSSSAACFQNGQVCRFNKYFGREKPAPPIQDGSQRNNEDSDVPSNWESRNHYHNGYRRGGGKPRIRSYVNPDLNDDELSYDDQRRSRNNYLKDGYSPLVVRQPPDDNHNSMIRGNFPDHYGSRVRSGFYKRGFVKGNRDQYHGPISVDLAPSSVWEPHNRSARRQYNTSPVFNRSDSFSCLGRKSPLRSRSRSPVPWHLQRERNVVARRISRSPDFRSEVRRGRNRMHYDDLKFSDDNYDFMPPPRRRFFNDRNSGPTCFRKRNSPGRFFSQRQSFGPNVTAGRTKTDDAGFRPPLNSERFSEQSGRGWRGRNNNSSYDGSDGERTRYNNNPEMIHRVRHCETGGADRHFRSDADDGFEDPYARRKHNSNNSCIRTHQKSDTLRNSWEGKRGHFKYDIDRRYSTSSKLPGS